ncbi:hypothetical protein [Actinomyces bowdenii]|uniref:Uncharacterized protein n=1 Tax=Actinomyces bowdenii TaxID=131109 RepID=A0A3P1V6B9_9ACTO|nr:hypothetical protein [Actinomyces bowdenii]RRD29358.1 hypothetical protein EII10_06775 [Actinomyces bowdenii]
MTQPSQPPQASPGADPAQPQQEQPRYGHPPASAAGPGAPAHPGQPAAAMAPAHADHPAGPAYPAYSAYSAYPAYSAQPAPGTAPSSLSAPSTGYGAVGPAPAAQGYGGPGPVHDQYAATAAYPQGSLAEAGAPFAAGAGAAPAMGQAPAPHAAGPAGPPAQSSPYRAVPAWAPSAPQPWAASAVSAGAPPAARWPEISPAPVAAGTAGPGASRAAPRTKGPAVVIGFSAVVIMGGIIAFVSSLLLSGNLDDGFSEIRTNGAVAAELSSGERYGLYHLTEEAPSCTVTDPQGRETAITPGNEKPFSSRNYKHFGTFTAASSGSYTISCSGQEEDTTWASPLVTSDDYDGAFHWALTGLALIILGIIPLVIASVVRARRIRAFLRAQTASLTSMAGVGAGGHMPGAWPRG